MSALPPLQPRSTLGLPSRAQAIPQLQPSPNAGMDDTPTSSSSASTFTAPKSFSARKKPMGLGLDITKSIPKPSRAAPGLPGGSPANGSGSGGMSEAERLREDIARLQLSTKSSFSSYPTEDADEVDSPGTSCSSLHTPATPTTNLLPMSETPASSRKKSTGATSTGKTSKKAHKDKDGQDLVKDEDLDILLDIGAGNGGTVTKVWNKKRNCVMARKLILVDAKPSVRKQIVRELQIMNDCNSPYIVGYYGCFPVDVHVGIVMELMDAGSLDHIYRTNGPVNIDVVGKVAEAVLRGLTYLYDVHRIIHRDIKPSNILANTAGEIKICDFGVSGELINSIANTFVGTSTYMSPERIQGAPYTIKSDIWSLGISLIELALGRFPFSDPPDSSSETDDGGDTDTQMEYDPDPTLPLNTARPKIIKSKSSSSKKKDSKEKKKRGVSLGGGGQTMSILDLLQHIVNEPAPRLVSRRRDFPEDAVSFVEWCLVKDPAHRKSPQDLLASDWLAKSTMTQADLRDWAMSLDLTE